MGIAFTLRTTDAMLRVQRLAGDVSSLATSGADASVLNDAVVELRSAVTDLARAARAERRDVVLGVRS